MRVLGYSERGAINALIFEIAFSSQPEQILGRLLERALFLGCTPPDWQANSARALIEQSLSDFGDADAILLLDHARGRTSVFVEGKVRGSQAQEWTLKEQFEAFQQGLSATVNSSNLFAQLYHKARFVDAVRTEGQLALHAGLDFPSFSTKRRRRIGRNPVVLRAVEQIAPYAADAYFLATVPDSPANVRDFVSGTLSRFTHESLELWDVSRWGFLCWSDVHDFCLENGLITTSQVLEFNKGQIW